MPKITREIHINARPHKVLEYIADVDHHPAFISALKSVEELTGNPRKHTTEWKWSFIMSGVELQGKATTVDYQSKKLYSFKTYGGIDSTFVYRVEPENSGTKLSVEVNYKLPETVLAKVANKSVIERYNEAEADRVGENLRSILEN